MRSMKFTLLALAVAVGLSAQVTPTPVTTIPVGTSINITGIGSQNTSGAFQVGGFNTKDLLVPMKSGFGGASQGFTAGSQATNGSLNFTVKGTNAAGVGGTIFNEGYTNTTATQTGGGFDKDGRTGVGSTAHGTLENFIKVDVKLENGTLGLGETGVGKLPAGMEIAGNGAMKHGTQAILGNLNVVTDKDITDWQTKYDAATPEIKKTMDGTKPTKGDVTGFTTGGFATTSGNGTFDFKANGLSANCGGNWIGGGKIDTFGNSYVNQIPNGFFSGATSTTTINVPTTPVKINVPTGK